MKGRHDPSFGTKVSRPARPASDDTIALPATPHERELPRQARRPSLGTDNASQGNEMPGTATITPQRAAWALSVDDVRLIRMSFERARPVLHVAPDLFYERLFYLAPSL